MDARTLWNLISVLDAKMKQEKKRAAIVYEDDEERITKGSLKRYIITCQLMKYIICIRLNRGNNRRALKVSNSKKVAWTPIISKSNFIN